MSRRLSGTMAIGIAAAVTTAAAAGERFHGNGYYDHAEVVDAAPIIEVVRLDDPKRVCWIQGNAGPGEYRPGSVLAGRGAGSAVDGSMREVAVPGYGPRRARHRFNGPAKRCEIRHDHYEEERIVGYDVAYRYNDRVHHTRMDRNPGDDMRVWVKVSVAE